MAHLARDCFCLQDLSVDTLEVEFSANLNLAHRIGTSDDTKGTGIDGRAGR